MAFMNPGPPDPSEEGAGAMTRAGEGPDAGATGPALCGRSLLRALYNSFRKDDSKSCVLIAARELKNISEGGGGGAGDIKTIRESDGAGVGMGACK